MNKSKKQYEYDLKLNRHEYYKSELNKLANGNNFTYTLLDGIKFKKKYCISSNQIQRYTYLFKKIENTHPMKHYTSKPINTKPINMEPKEESIIDDDDIASEDRYSILDSDDSDSISPSE